MHSTRVSQWHSGVMLGMGLATDAARVHHSAIPFPCNDSSLVVNRQAV